MKRVFAALMVLALGGCTLEHRLLPDDGGVPDGAVGLDTDLDTISDADEGRDARLDTDGDGVPDFRDLDSDDDGLPDQLEAGDGSLASAPRDSDDDGTPDFRDLDSDDNLLPDAVEGAGDHDEDRIPDFADLDDDNDLVRDGFEIAGVLSPFIDSDDDGRPNFRDPDSDNDLILDGDEFGIDTDGDGLMDHEDLDTDGDGIPDRVEAGDEDTYSPPYDTDGDGIPDFRDLDSDSDGLPDFTERAEGTDPTLADTDGDGVDDLIERAAGTDPLDRTVSPRTRGDFVFTVDYMEPPDPPVDTLEFRTSIQFADVYFLFDISVSMDGEIAALRSAVTTLMDELSCTDSGIPCRADADCARTQVCSLTGTCIADPATSACVASPWSGGGYYEDHFRNLLSLQSSPAATSSALAVSTFGGTEELFGAVWSALDPVASPNEEMGCAPSMAGRLGCVGFREEAVRILVAFTDEDSDGTETVDQAAAALRDAGVTFIGVWSGSPTSTQRQDLIDLATLSGSVDRTGAPLYFEGTDAAVVPAVAGAINEIVEGVPLRVTIAASDEPGDAGDALQFLDYVEVNVGGGPCSAVSPTVDTDDDGHDDAFPALVPGTPVCWDVHPARNETVPRAIEPQVFEARLTVSGDGSPLDARVVYFLIPPRIELPILPD